MIYTYLREHLFYLTLILFVGFVSSCSKDEPPYEYPEEPIPTEPEIITHFQRSLSPGENWTKFNEETGCKGDLSAINYAYYEIDTGRGFATMHLIPDSSSCELQVSLETTVRDDEIANVDWDDLSFEFTFSELILNAQTELWLELRYKEYEMKVDFAPLILQVDSNIENGVIEVYQDEEGLKYFVNGSRVRPDFDLPGNLESLSAIGDDPMFGVDLISQGSSEQSLLVFQFLRITSFTIPES